MLVFMAVGEKRGEKRPRDSDVKADSGVKAHKSKAKRIQWHKKDERYGVLGTFRSALFAWNDTCEFTGKRFVPYWWDGGHFDVHPRYHGA
jgi:hypothetical protein